MILTEQQAGQNLQSLVDKYKSLSADDRKVMSEATVVRQFIDILLRDVLCWPIEEPARYRYEQVTQVGRPDMMLTPEKGGTIFVEAKRFGVIKELPQARQNVGGAITPSQLGQPGMAVGRTPEEQQAINYAFFNNGTWAFLTNFEKLRVFNARRDTLVLSFEEVGDYLRDFNTLWQLSYQNVLEGSLEALSNQRFTAEVDTNYLSFINEWREKLAQDIVEHRTANPWAFADDNSIDLVLLRSVVQRIIDRLVIIRFAEDQFVVPAGTLRGLYELRQQNMYTDLHQMIDTMFRRFDQAHNSALFSYGLADQAVIADDLLVQLFQKLYEARYRAMPPDIMGNTYEQYLGKTLVRRNGSIATADNLETRKKQGSYYTPQVIVRYIVDNSLGHYLYGTEDGKTDGTSVPGEARKTSAEIKELRVLDGACGSGSFLIYAYEVLHQFYQSEKERLQAEFSSQLDSLSAQKMLPNDIRIELSPLQAELDRLAHYQRLILETHLYGVDLDPQAAEIAVVNLMMRAMERHYGDEQRRSEDKQLPLILNQNVKVGNSLIGLRPDDPRLADYRAEIAAIRQLRADLIRVPHNTPDHERIVTELAAATTALHKVLDSNFTDYFTDLAAVRPFHWGSEFPEAFFDAEGRPLDNPGFTIIFGNPPWEILKPDLREFYAQFDDSIESRLNRQQVESRIAELVAEEPSRRAAFEVGVKTLGETSTYIHTTDDYQRQGRGDMATHKLFLERMYGLLRDEGRLGYLVPSGIYTDLGTKELREMLLNEGNIQYIFSFSNERFFFVGVDHRFKFALVGAQKGPQKDGFWSVFRFNPRVAIAPADLPDFLAERKNLIYVERTSLVRFSPDSLSVMEFQTPRDYEVAEKIYGDWPLLGDNTVIWSVNFANEFHMTNDRDLFNTQNIGLPLYEGKMIHQFDAYFSEPQYWVDERKGRTRYLGRATDSGQPSNYQQFRLGVRAIASSTNERTLITAIIPTNSFAGHSLWIDFGLVEPNVTMFVMSVMNSYCLDALLRLKMTTNVSQFYLQQLPLPRLTAGNPYFDAIVPRAARLTCTRPEFADLWQEVMAEAWDESKGATDPAERQRLRDEIDAIVTHLYGLSRDDFDHILGTFPLVFPDDDAGRAKRAVLLAVYDQWAGKL